MGGKRITSDLVIIIKKVINDPRCSELRLSDVAKLCGASEATVSRVKNGYYDDIVRTTYTYADVEKVEKSVENEEKSGSDRVREYAEIMPKGALIDLSRLIDLGFFEAPASTKYHGAYSGGLFDHSLEVTKALVELTVDLGLKWDRPESPYIVGMYHDLCKCDSYVWDIETDNYRFNEDTIIPGHGDKSVIVAQKYIALTDEEIACIRWHMGAYETDTKLWNYYGRAIEKYPNVLYTHTADMIASKIKGI